MKPLLVLLLLIGLCAAQDPNAAKKTVPTAQGVYLYSGSNCADSPPIIVDDGLPIESTGSILYNLIPNTCMDGGMLTGTVCGDDMVFSIPSNFLSFNYSSNCTQGGKVYIPIPPNVCSSFYQGTMSILAVCPVSSSSTSTTLILAVAIPLGVVFLSLMVWCIRKRGARGP